jgi:hypothetical protein
MFNLNSFNTSDFNISFASVASVNSVNSVAVVTISISSVSTISKVNVSPATLLSSASITNVSPKALAIINAITMASSNQGITPKISSLINSLTNIFTVNGATAKESIDDIKAYAQVLNLTFYLSETNELITCKLRRFATKHNSTIYISDFDRHISIAKHDSRMKTVRIKPSQYVDLSV